MMLLTSQPLWLSAVLLVGGATLLAMIGPVVVRRRVSLERLSTTNEVAGFKFATVGVLYAVLRAFAVIIVWEKFSGAENLRAQTMMTGALSVLIFSGLLIGIAIDHPFAAR